MKSFRRAYARKFSVGRKLVQQLALIGAALSAFTVFTASAADFECVTKQWWQVDGSGSLVQAAVEANSFAENQRQAAHPFYVDRSTGRLRGALPGLLPAKPNVTVLSRGSASHPFAAVYAGAEMDGVRLVSTLSIQANPQASNFTFILDDTGQLLTGICKWLR